jgi:hypothetical protein
MHEGRGFEQQRDGSCFEGVYRKGQLQQGTLYHFDRKTMKAEILEPREMLEYLKGNPCCAMYSGHFQDGVYHGQGEYRWGDGKRYSGAWAEGRMHGRGEFFWPDGKYYNGEYYKDEKNGRGIMVWGRERIFEGMFSHGLPCGYGMLLTAQRTIFGKWARGRFEEELTQEQVQPFIRLNLLRLPDPQAAVRYKDNEEDNKTYFDPGLLHVALQLEQDPHSS